MIFQNRSEAGKKLADALTGQKGDLLVMGLARGGVVVAAEIAKALHAPLTVALVRKIGAPDNEELALGAIAEKGTGVFNDELIALLGISKEYIKKEVERQRELLLQRKASYFGNKKPIDPKGKTVILVDDGIATGASMRVAIQSVRAQEASSIILAVPVAPPDSLAKLSSFVDQVICLSSPAFFQAVGAFYKSFPQVTDEEVRKALKHS